MENSQNTPNPNQFKFRFRRKRLSRNYYSSYIKTVAASFFGVILTGTLLLMLPISIKDGTSVNFLDALLTATSATCVTGLIVFDTFTKWTLFGQIVILCLIQVGGLGFITILTMMSRFLKKRVNLREKLVLKESFGSIPMGDTKKIVRVVLIGTAFFEILGAVILCTQFIPSMGFKNGLFTSVFLSVSAFCNAGFDVMGRILPGSSLVTVNSNPVILLTIALLIIIGGIGFIVWDDIAFRKFNVKKFGLHTKLTLLTTAVLLITGTVIYYIFERENTFAGMSEWQKILNAFFTSATTRTAGFNSVPTDELSTESKVITDILMFIGGSPAGTAGGIKTTTAAMLFLTVLCVLKGQKDTECFGRRVDMDTVRSGITITLITFTCWLAAVAAMSVFDPQTEFLNLMYEASSAIGTVGLSADLTPHLSRASHVVLMMLMYIGRIGPLTMALVFAGRSNKSDKFRELPEKKIMLG